VTARGAPASENAAGVAVTAAPPRADLWKSPVRGRPARRRAAQPRPHVARRDASRRCNARGGEDVLHVLGGGVRAPGARPEDAAAEELLLHERLHLQRVAGGRVERDEAAAVHPHAAHEGEVELAREVLHALAQPGAGLGEARRDVEPRELVEGRPRGRERERLAAEGGEEEDVLIEEPHHVAPPGQDGERHAVGDRLREAGESCDAKRCALAGPA
jgi:hypothetical protein